MRHQSAAAESTTDVLVVGGGHAGTEAATAAARAGASVLLVTAALDTIGQLSCNPAIGGIAKSAVVREVDALGGLIARATDQSTLQFRMLNRGKGPAVWAPRAQVDRGLYRRAIRLALEAHPRLHLAQGTVAHLRLDPDQRRVRGVVTTDGRRFDAMCTILTTGTFLRGRLHVGTTHAADGGRAGEPAALDLARQLEALGLPTRRFKTGTPPRIDGRSVALDTLERQESEIEHWDYSWSHFWTTPRRAGATTRHPPQHPCWITHLHDHGITLIQQHLHDSAMYGGAIGSRGPRYCPSVEDKVVRFPTARRHQLFLEPEGLDTHELYVNGLSTSLPADVQRALLHTIPGLEQARMTRAGYAIEYDCYDPTALTPTLAVQAIDGLFFAGQINGTTGYEEAAAQGVVAGLNAAHAALDRAPVPFPRETSYIGVLVDDLVRKGADEPYRLFTSRSEFRLTLRQDNALLRLGPLGETLALYTADEAARVARAPHQVAAILHRADHTSISVEQATPLLALASDAQQDPLPHAVRVSELARRHGIPLWTALAAADPHAVADLDPHWQWTADLELKYAGYFARERQRAARRTALATLAIPAAALEAPALSTEARHRLAATSPRPATVADAASLAGISPADLDILIYESRRYASRAQ